MTAIDAPPSSPEAPALLAAGELEALSPTDWHDIGRGLSCAEADRLAIALIQSDAVEIARFVVAAHAADDTPGQRHYPTLWLHCAVCGRVFLDRYKVFTDAAELAAAATRNGWTARVDGGAVTGTCDG